MIPDNAAVNYIKLGKGGNESKKCFDNGLVYIGFNTDQEKLFNLCRDRNWSKASDVLKEYGNKKNTQTINILKRFFEDNGETIWITFENQRMYWCFLEPDSEFRDRENNNAVYKKVRDKWLCTTIEAEPKNLDMINLAGDLTQLHSYPGTSTVLYSSRAKYVITKINGKETEEVGKAKEKREELVNALKCLVTKLAPKDFELLIELIFAQSGWKRISATGGTTKFHDGVMEQAAINERAAIQVKSKTRQKEFDEYLEEFYQINNEKSTFDRFYYIYHTASKELTLPSNIRPSYEGKIYIWDNSVVCQSLIDAGLTDWLIKRVA